MGFVKNLPAALRGVELRFQRVKDMTRDEYRAFVWKIFLRILRESPQGSGKGVAHWNLSVGAPNYNQYPDAGDELIVVDKNFDGAKQHAAHQKGDQRWMRVARDRARPIKDGIFLKDKVFISNGATGDGDDVGAELYMQALQNIGYWSQKLREVNKPYETAQQTAIVIGMETMNRGLFTARVDVDNWDTI